MTRRAGSLAFVTLFALFGCTRKHVREQSVAELPYPGCEAGAPARALEVAYRSGKGSLERDVTERFELSRDACGQLVATTHQEWRLSVDDVEVVFDREGLPLRAWKRMTIPGSSRPDGHADVRRYELRTPEVTIKRRTAEGEIIFERLLPGGRAKAEGVHGTRPTAVVGPGRGLMTVWLQRVKLPVGGKAREWVLDFREMVEKVQLATLVRDADRFDPGLNRNVRVYTLYGRESVFADERDVVIGDLGGLVRDEALEGRPFAHRFGAPDPVRTP